MTSTIDRRRLRRPAAALLLVLSAALALLLGGAGTASAHAALVSTDPAPDSVVATAPSQVVLTFSEGVTLSDNSVQVFDPGGKQADLGSPAHADGKDATAAVQLRDGLAQGTYTVSWRAVSEDSHPVSGAFTFSIGKQTQTAVPAAVAGREGGSSTVGALYGIARAVAYGTFALLVGSAAFILLCWPRGVSARPVQRLLMTGWGGLLLSTVAVVLLRGPYEKGSGLGDAFDLSLVRTTLDERLGTALAARLLLLAAAGVFLSLLVGQLSQSGQAAAAGTPAAAAGSEDSEEAELRRLEQRAAGRSEREARIGLGVAGLLLALALAATWAGADHAAVGLQVDLALPLDMLHLVAMAVWLGGLVTLLIGLSVPRDRGGVTAGAVGVFSRTAFWCVTVLVATGVYQAWRGLGSWSAFTGTDYGRLLLVKIGCVVVLLGAAWFSRGWTARLRALGPLPELVVAPVEPEPVAAGADDTPRDAKRRAQLERQRALRVAAADRRAKEQAAAREQAAGADRSGLRRSVLVEAGVAVAVLAVTTLLTNAPPGRTAQVATAAGTAAPAAAAAQPVNLTIPYDTGGSGAGAKGNAAIVLDPARSGPNTLHVAITDAAGKPVEVPEVRVAFDLPAKKLGPLRPTLQKATGGHWYGQVQLPMAGDWQLSLTVRSSDIDETTETAPVRIG
ncbi:FixH family protein [Peterkaempfera sp. SMS 1(5)a]|uniref:FixH family protein n=1 Tax=Peterkaempfera podocarpi TaxID=3232308 RepID=UPI00366B94CC